MSGSIVQIFLAVLLLLFAFYKILMIVKQTRLNNASKMWPVTSANVLHKEVLTHRNSKGNTSYTPEITYQYSVFGSEYNHNIRLNGLWSWNSAQKALDAIGDRIDVRYNPDNPKENANSYTKVRFIDYLFILVIMGLAAFILILQLI